MIDGERLEVGGKGCDGVRGARIRNKKLAWKTSFSVDVWRAGRRKIEDEYGKAGAFIKLKAIQILLLIIAKKKKIIHHVSTVLFYF